MTHHQAQAPLPEQQGPIPVQPRPSHWSLVWSIYDCRLERTRWMRQARADTQPQRHYSVLQARFWNRSLVHWLRLQRTEQAAASRPTHPTHPTHPEGIQP